jgi:uncharacterized membrane protein
LGRRLSMTVMALIAGLILLPLAVFAVGQLMAGPYAGSGGFLGFLGSIYIDLITGKPSAWILTLSPALLMGIGYLLFRRPEKNTPPAPAPAPEKRRNLRL